MVFKAQVADSVIKKLTVESRQLSGALSASDQSAAAAREAKDLAIQAGVKLEDQVKLTEQKAKYWERLSKRWKGASIGGGVIIILEIIAILALAL